jgi:hypothetical protein
MIQGSRLVETSASVFIGSLLVADATTGLAKAAADAGAGATVFLGICTGFKYLTAELTTAAVVGNGTIVAEYATGHEVLLPCAASVTAADNGKAVYCLDDEGVTDASTAGPGCGKFIELESTLTAWVLLGAIALPLAT